VPREHEKFKNITVMTHKAGKMSDDDFAVSIQKLDEGKEKLTKDIQSAKLFFDHTVI
jgi:hypothetical protein